MEDNDIIKRGEKRERDEVDDENQPSAKRLKSDSTELGPSSETQRESQQVTLEQQQGMPSHVLDSRESKLKDGMDKICICK